MKRSYYSSYVSEFLQRDHYQIFGEITANDSFGAEDLQKNSWKQQIHILKRELSLFPEGRILFEYTIPRMGKRVDNILLYQGIIYLIEFKIGEHKFPNYAKDQVVDYALDLKYFHKESYNKLIVPILVSTEVQKHKRVISMMDGQILDLHCTNQFGIGEYIKDVSNKFKKVEIDPTAWEYSIYTPTPTIVEAARTLYQGHSVEFISRNDASAINLNKTTEAIHKIIDNSKKNNKKSICFITGVPGAGKTLAGLNIAVERQKFDIQDHAVFLSGNGPLVEVLQEALARDDVEKYKVRKKDALRKSKEFIQLIYHFRDEAISVKTPPIEKVVIFDEAQRAWDEPHLSRFMYQKKGKGTV